MKKVVMDKVAVITGTNSNLGLNIAYRLIEKQPVDAKLTIVVTSRTLSRVREVVSKIKGYAEKKAPGRISFDYLLVDFTDMISILNASYELDRRYNAIHYFYINAAQGLYEGINWGQATIDVLRNPLDAVTNPTYKIQKVGVKSQDGIGLVFQANVFGPYYLIRRIKPLLSRGNSVVVWISSVMSDPKYLSLQDIQLLTTNASYEGSKRLVDLIHLGTFKELQEQGIRQFVTHPGIFTSQSFLKYLNFFTYYSMLALFYVARLMGSRWHNIDGYKAANAPVYVSTLEAPCEDDQKLKYGSATHLNGKEYVFTDEVDATGLSDVKKYFEDLAMEWDERLKDQLKNTYMAFYSNV